MKLTTWTGSRAALDEIAPDHLQRIEVENHADALHQPLERKIHLRPAEPADEPHGSSSLVRISRKGRSRG